MTVVQSRYEMRRRDWSFLIFAATTGRATYTDFREFKVTTASDIK